MAAITGLSIPANENPISTGWTTITGLGTVKAVSSVMSPVTPSSTSGLIYNTAFTEVDSASETKGVIAKWTIGGGLEDGSKIRCIYDYTDVDNYRYVEVHKAGIVVFTDRTNDTVTLWKRVAGVESQVFGDTPLLDRQAEYGDLRHYTIEAGDSITIVKVLDQHIVKASVTDLIDGLDQEDLILFAETDGSASAVSRKIGVAFVGSTHTNTITSVQAALITAKFCATTGSDSAAGCQDAPYLTLAKLMENTATNQIGFIVAGTYTQNVTSLSYTLTNGTSYEDAPTFLPYQNGVVLHRSTSEYCYYVKEDAHYRVFCGWTMEVVSGGTGSNAVKLWAQAAGGSGLVPKRFRFQRVVFKGAAGGANVLLNQGTFSGTPTTADYEHFHHFIDCVSQDADSALSVLQGTHGFYIESSRNLVEYCQCLNVEGDGGKFFYGVTGGVGGVPVSNNNMARFNLMDGFGQYGWICAGGTNNICHSSTAKNGLRPNGGAGGYAGFAATGFMIGYGAIDNKLYNNVALDNEIVGMTVEGKFGAQVTGGRIYNNTSFRNKYNYSILTNASPSDASPDDIMWKNNCAYGYTSGGANFSYNNNGSYQSTDPGHATNLAFATNHSTSSTGAGWLNNGGVTGDPDFVSTTSGSEDLRLGSTSSVLYQAGSNLTALFGEDYDLRPIPQDAAYEIGAFAFAFAFEPSGLRVIDPGGTPALAWDEEVGVSKTRIFVQWSGKKRWWEAPDAAGGVKADGSGVFNEIAASPLVLPAAALKFSIRQYDGAGDPLEAETDQIDWDNS